MEFLPDNIWCKILKTGIETEKLDHGDLCSLAIVNSHFDQLTKDTSLWTALISRDFPSFSPFYQAPPKDHYRLEHLKRKTFGRWDPWSDEFFLNLTKPSIWTPPKLGIIELKTPICFEGAFECVLPQYKEHDSVRNQHYENKPSRRFDKLPKPKVIPNSKSYIPMNRPPRRSMPRKN